MTVHRVKSWPDYFEPIFSGNRTFDLRVNDRRYHVGDVLHLMEYDDRKAVFTGREIKKTITDLIEGIGTGCITPMKGLSRGYVVLALQDQERP